jgi:hypothetical protein
MSKPSSHEECNLSELSTTHQVVEIGRQEWRYLSTVAFKKGVGSNSGPC